jgi:hypothetical protein
MVSAQTALHQPSPLVVATIYTANHSISPYMMSFSLQSTAVGAAVKEIVRG